MSDETEGSSQEPPLMDGNVFEYLMCLNQKVEGAIDLLRRLARYPALNTKASSSIKPTFVSIWPMRICA